MRLRVALTGLSVIGLVVGAAPATATCDSASLTLVVTADGTEQTYSADGVELGAGPELIGEATCDLAAVVDVDPASRTITVNLAQDADAVEVELTLESDAIGGVVPVTSGLADLTMTVTPEIAIVTWSAPPRQVEGCAPSTAVFSYVAPEEPLPDTPIVIDSAVLGAQSAPADASAPAAAVVASPSFAG
jgi:hypothetical protein